MSHTIKIPGLRGARAPLIFENDFISPTNPYNWSVFSSSGTQGSSSGVNQHQGSTLLGSTAVANTGYSVNLGSTQSLDGNEEVECCFRCPAVSATTNAKIGWANAVAMQIIASGIYINVTNLTLNGKSTLSSVTTTTGSSYTITANTWYRTKVVIPTTSRVEFYLYNENGDLLWSDAISGSLPTGLGVYWCAAAYNTGTAALSILEIDYMAFIDNRLGSNR